MYHGNDDIAKSTSWQNVALVVVMKPVYTAHPSCHVVWSLAQHVFQVCGSKLK